MSVLDTADELEIVTLLTVVIDLISASLFRLFLVKIIVLTILILILSDRRFQNRDCTWLMPE